MASKKKSATAPSTAQPDVSTLLAAALLNSLSGVRTSGRTRSIESAVASGAITLDASGFPIVTFDPDGGPISITLVLGMRHRMFYTLALWDEEGTKKLSVEGRSWDNEPDIHSFDATADLAEDHLFWDVTITQSAAGTGDFYYLAIIVEQDGAALAPAFEYAGPLSGTEIISGALVFKTI